MSICEDYPCCGHTDGLGCDWVSPNEVVPCDVCIEARATRPYHNRVVECPTERARAQESVPADSVCDCGEEADIMLNYEAVCYGCYEDARDYDRQMSDIYGA
jgi:hypothetical protein